ncbi:hypothetical protein NECAME_03238 [Necator americanus]|uniref:Uncharacterized protein n=1 Tax=Necator americanus TaxID=51031 RepID=W2T5F0_NECAM|nr:hypothetical protein NECAME_03238 [Necator americanus]ETN77138.1 hypothetical protein NECAME_03238 [Necator americanus]
MKGLNAVTLAGHQPLCICNGKVIECNQKLAQKNEEGKTEFTQNSFCLTPRSIDQPKKPHISSVQNSEARKADVSHTQHSKEDEILDVKGTRKKRITAQNQEEARTQQFLDEISTNGTTQDRTADAASSIEKAVKNIELNEITQNTLLTQEDRDARPR